MFCYLAGLYDDPHLFAEVVAALASVAPREVDRLLAIEARGFVLGAALSARLGVPLTLARKPGKLPGETCTAHYTPKHGADSLQVQKGAVGAGERVLVVDEVLATGGTLAGAAELVQGQGADVAGLAVVMSLAGLGGGDRLAAHRLASLVEVTA